MNKGTRKVVGNIFFWLLIGIIFIYLMFPFYWAFISALKPEAELIRTPTTYYPHNPTWQNFQAVLRSGDFLRGLLNSTIVAFCVTALSLLVGSFAGYAMGKMRFRGKSPSLYIILAMTMFPQIAVLAGLYTVIRLLSLPPLFSMILSYMLFTLPFTVWVLTSFFRGLTRFALAGGAGGRGQHDADLLANLVATHGSSSCNHRTARLYSGLERIPLRADLHHHCTRSANGAGSHCALYRGGLEARTLR